MVKDFVNGGNSTTNCANAAFINLVYVPMHGDITMKINKDDHNWYGFDTDKVCNTFEGDLTYLNTFCILGHYNPVAVFRNTNPNRSKNHKDFMLLWMKPNITGNKGKGMVSRIDGMVSGINADGMEEYRYQKGMYCPDCKEVIYSVNRHDHRKCSCGKCMVDGGKDYFRTNMAGTVVKIDLLTDEITIEGA